jgi:hypothetical protein
MKTIRALPLVFAILLFTGCSSTFLGDFARSSAADDDPDAHWYDDPWFQTSTEYIPPTENLPSVDQGAQTIRNAGYVRRDPNNTGANNSRSTGAARNTNQTGSQGNTNVNVPTRGSTGTPTGAPQKNASGNATQDRSGKR